MTRPPIPCSYCPGCNQEYELTEPDTQQLGTILAPNEDIHNSNASVNGGTAEDNPVPPWPCVCMHCKRNTCFACVMREWKSPNRPITLGRYDIPCMHCKEPDGHSAARPTPNSELMLVLCMIKEMAATVRVREKYSFLFVTQLVTLVAIMEA
jgi:hypothetical protein